MRKKTSTKRKHDAPPSGYDLARLGPGIRGKYYQQAVAGTNLVLLDPELARVFKDSASVNRALRLLLNTAESAAVSRPSTRKRTPATK